MSRKNNLLKYQVVTSGAMSAPSITSAVSNIQFLDNIGIQFNFTGSPTGTFAIQVSSDYAADAFGNVTNAGNWAPLILSYLSTGTLTFAASIPTSVGSPIYSDLNQLSAPWIRSVYTNTLAESVNIATVPDAIGSLNSRDFLINGANGTNWYVWYSNGTGIDPALPGRTGIQVTYANNDSANTIATLTRAALVACTSITSIGGATNHVTFSQSVVGPGSVTDGVAATGFTFTYTSNTGTLNAFITAKMV